MKTEAAAVTQPRVKIEWIDNLSDLYGEGIFKSFFNRLNRKSGANNMKVINFIQKMYLVGSAASVSSKRKAFLKVNRYKVKYFGILWYQEDARNILLNMYGLMIRLTFL